MKQRIEAIHPFTKDFQPAITDFQRADSIGQGYDLDDVIVKFDCEEKTRVIKWDAIKFRTPKSA